MEFDKSKVFTAVNADEVKIGSKGYFAGSLAELKANVGAESDGYRGRYFGTVKFIDSESEVFRFIRKEDDEGRWGLFYLVEEPEEKKFRPYKDWDEMIADFKRRYSSYGGWVGRNNPMYNPLIWVQKKSYKVQHLITGFNGACLRIDYVHYSFEELFDDFTYLDGTPCGIEEATE